MKKSGIIKLGIAAAVVAIIIIAAIPSKKEKENFKEAFRDTPAAAPSDVKGDLSAAADEFKKAASDAKGEVEKALKDSGVTDALASAKKASSGAGSKALKAYEDLVVSMEKAANKKDISSLVSLSEKALKAADELEGLKDDLSADDLAKLTKLTGRYAAAAAKMTDGALDSAAGAMNALKGFGF